MSNTPVIRLYDTYGVGLIILWPSNVLYTNQTGGYACLQPSVEGVFVPLHNELIDQERLLFEYFTGPKWAGCCCRGIDNETADEIDAILGLAPATQMLRVNRSQLYESYEAWIYVEIGRGVEDEVAAVLSGFTGCAGVLTWGNSD